MVGFDAGEAFDAQAEDSYDVAGAGRPESWGVGVAEDMMCFCEGKWSDAMNIRVERQRKSKRISSAETEMVKRSCRRFRWLLKSLSRLTIRSQDPKSDVNPRPRHSGTLA